MHAPGGSVGCPSPVKKSSLARCPLSGIPSSECIAYASQYVGVASKVKQRMQKVASPNGVQLQPMLLFPEVGLACSLLMFRSFGCSGDHAIRLAILHNPWIAAD